ncbi:hypothetical protein N7461_007498 [Penicillium sp. DV-2018c]|nr:hypothetical protein N7461_007498 [Penicillium sp. DV-2018c]
MVQTMAHAEPEPSRGEPNLTSKSLADTPGIQAVPDELREGPHNPKSETTNPQEGAPTEEGHGQGRDNQGKKDQEELDLEAGLESIQRALEAELKTIQLMQVRKTLRFKVRKLMESLGMTPSQEGAPTEEIHDQDFDNQDKVAQEVLALEAKVKKLEKVEDLRLQVQRKKESLRDSASLMTSEPSQETQRDRGEDERDVDETEMGVEESEMPPPNPVDMVKFNGKTRKSWEAFEDLMELHFDQYPRFFANEKNKVIRASYYLENELLLEWCRQLKEYRKSPQGYPTWKEFTTWCEKRVEDPRVAFQKADQKFSAAVQKPKQTVLQYHRYLLSVFSSMKFEPTEAEKIRRLETGVKKELWMEADKRPELPDDASYEQVLTHYQQIESDLKWFSELAEKESKKEQEQTRKDGNKRKRSAQEETKKDQKRPKFPKCPHCGLHNHPESKCFFVVGFPKGS